MTVLLTLALLFFVERHDLGIAQRPRPIWPSLRSG